MILCSIEYRPDTQTHAHGGLQYPNHLSGRYHHTTSVLRPLFRDHPGEPVPEENFWTLWCKGRHTNRPAGRPAGLTSAHLHHRPIFTGRMSFLPPNKQCQSTEGNCQSGRYRYTGMRFDGLTYKNQKRLWHWSARTHCKACSEYSANITDQLTHHYFHPPATASLISK